MEERILRALGEVDEQYIKEAEAMKKTNNINNLKKWVSIVAVFVLIIMVGIGVFQTGLFGAKTDVATLETGETITFVKGDVPETSMDLDVTERPLTEEEIKMLFADLNITANAYFDTESHNMIGFEGEIGDVKLIVCESDVKLLDTVLEGSEYNSSIGNISITAGYFISKANSQGMKTVIYYASFDIGENSIYVEYSGEKNDSDSVKDELVKGVRQIIENGEFDLSQIKE